ncbi:MAG TPA: peptidoglycan-binding domain-containing protein [Actinophytocola sp.]|uniref:peptidoglycan-binding domain-containing protein n=1 Tax=Actinophytocola sp. TaxID=1872138 RepID=UPI002DDCAD7C|nr:peptidoglycan-binding domain-containing protein [Actinophytocola sp.]HEV2781652.1 peptidoglycan-binding domain-containing protein [Actinophytocola sp.]
MTELEPTLDQKEGPRAVRKRRTVRAVIITVAVLAVLGAGTGVVLTRIAARPATAAPEPPGQVETAEVTRADLSDQRTETGNLGYGAEHSLSGRRQGTLTALPTQGAVLERGQPVYSVDATPVVLFYSDIPLYRDVGSGVTEGPDVKAVEENLAALGFTGFGTPNTKFTDATANAIKKWQKSLGLEQTGVIRVGDVVTASGPLRVSSVSAEPGGQATTEVCKYTSTQRAVTLDLAASDKDLAKPGTKVTLTVAGKEVAGTVATLAPKPADSSNDQNRPPGDGGNSEQQFTATITVDDQASIGDLDAGSVDVRFTTGSREGVLVVPIAALLALAEGGYAVEVVDGTQRRLVAVRPGLFDNGKVEVTGDGLAEGMNVVTTS